MSSDGHKNEIGLQRQYYERTAAKYDIAHLETGEGHDLATLLLKSLMEHYEYRSLLDVGAGTGRTLRKLKKSCPDCLLTGIEPVEAMRQVGHQHGLSPEELRSGDATQLAFADGSFDVVSAFGVLHHVRNPAIVIGEMLRVARRAVFISDANRFAQGNALMRRVKRWSWQLGLWPALDFVRTRGQGYTVTAGDGVSYSYSVFDHQPLLKAHCERIHWFGLTGSNGDLTHSADQIALLAVKHGYGPSTTSRDRPRL